MVSVVASIVVADGKRDEFIRLFNELIPTVHAEDGCIEYFPAIDEDMNLDIQELDENCVTIVEKWESSEHLKAHLAAPHMDEFRSAVSEIVTSLSIRVVKPAS